MRFSRCDFRFSSLSYFRDVEDNNVQGRSERGNGALSPAGGLIGNNVTEGRRPFHLAGHALESTAKQEEILSTPQADPDRRTMGKIRGRRLR